MINAEQCRQATMTHKYPIYLLKVEELGKEQAEDK